MRLLIAKTILQLVLLTVFIFMYAFPAFQRLIKHETIVLKSLENRGGIKAPSITVTAYSPETAMGWRMKPEEPQAELRYVKFFTQIESFKPNFTQIYLPYLLHFATLAPGCNDIQLQEIF